MIWCYEMVDINFNTLFVEVYSVDCFYASNVHSVVWRVVLNVRRFRSNGHSLVWSATLIARSMRQFVWRNVIVDEDRLVLPLQNQIPYLQCCPPRKESASGDMRVIKLVLSGLYSLSSWSYMPMVINDPSPCRSAQPPTQRWRFRPFVNPPTNGLA